MIKQIFIDTETTGVLPWKHGLYQVAGIIRCGKRREEFNLKCNIFDKDDIDPKAFEANSMTPEIISTFPSPRQAYEEFVQILNRYIDKYDKQDKFIAIGYGAEFDSQFLRKWFEKNGDTYFGSWFWHPWIDVMQMAAYYFREERRAFPNFKLGTMADQFGIALEGNYHDALYDIRVTEKVYDMLESEMEGRRRFNEKEGERNQGNELDDVPF